MFSLWTRWHDTLIFSEVCIPTLILLLTVHTNIINICQNRTVIEVEKYDVDKVL